MKGFAVAVGCFMFTLGAFAQSTPSPQKITAGVIRAATDYATAVSCDNEKIDSTRVAALVPYKSFTDRLEAKYVVLWDGDLGCLGGSGTNLTNLAIVTAGAGDSFVVAPSRSSPIIKFEAPARLIERIVASSRDSLTLEGKEHGSEDASCCPSIPVRFTLRSDSSGNWRLTEKMVVIDHGTSPQQRNSNQPRGSKSRSDDGRLGTNESYVVSDTGCSRMPGSVDEAFDAAKSQFGPTMTVVRAPGPFPGGDGARYFYIKRGREDGSPQPIIVTATRRLCEQFADAMRIAR